MNDHDRNIYYLLDLYENNSSYENNYVKGERRSTEHNRKRKREEKRKNRHLLFDELLLETKTLIFTHNEKKLIRYLIDDFNNDFQYLHRRASEKCIILAFMFFLKKLETPQIRLDRYSICKKYGLTDHVFELILCRLTLKFMHRTPIRPRPHTKDNHDILIREGKR
jgi:hypothetical protein